MARRSRLLIALMLATPCHAGAQPDDCDPEILAEAWLPVLERLHAALPALSPREEEWLTAELNADNPQRNLRAVGSTTYAIREAKLDSGSLLASFKILAGQVVPRDHRSPTEQLAALAYTLIDYDAAPYLARLEAEGIVERAEIPWQWTVFADSDYPLEESIRERRVALASSILLCLLPQGE